MFIIYRLATSNCRYLVPYSPVCSTRREDVGPGVYLGPLFWRKGRSLGVSDGTIRKSDGGVSQALHCDHCAISKHSGAICHRMSPTLKSTGVSHFWAKSGDEKAAVTINHQKKSHIVLIAVDFFR